MMVVEVQYNLGDMVYLKTDPDSFLRMITAIQVAINGSIIYKLSLGTLETWHYDQEITTEKITV